MLRGRISSFLTQHDTRRSWVFEWPLICRCEKAQPPAVLGAVLAGSLESRTAEGSWEAAWEVQRRHALAGAPQSWGPRPLSMKTTTPVLRTFARRLHTTHYKLFLIWVDVLPALKFSISIQRAGTVCSKYKSALEEVSNFSSAQYLWHSCVSGLGGIFRFPEQIKQLVKA